MSEFFQETAFDSQNLREPLDFGEPEKNNKKEEQKIDFQVFYPSEMIFEDEEIQQDSYAEMQLVEDIVELKPVQNDFNFVSCFSENNGVEMLTPEIETFPLYQKDSIVEYDGVFVIPRGLESDNIKIDVDFKNLVDSLLKK